MKHGDDGGNLTLFADETNILIACDKGHFWTLPATRGEVEPEGRDDTDTDADAGDGGGGRADGGPRRRRRMPKELEPFGDAALDALGQ